MGPILLFTLLLLTGAFFRTPPTSPTTDTVGIPICRPPAEGPDRGEVFVYSMQVDHITIQFRAGIREGNVTRFVRLLAEAQKHRPQYVLVRLDSPGGIVEEGRRMARAIEASPVPVLCLVTGEAASSAFYVLQSCAYRMMVPDAQLLAHEIYQPWAERIDRYAAKKFYDDLEKDALPFIEYETRRLRIPRDEFIAKTKERDWTMNATEALAVGAVDEIVEATSRP
jgi:ATP-dependent protease ClpP protease subunit